MLKKKHLLSFRKEHHVSSGLIGWEKSAESCNTVAKLLYERRLSQPDLGNEVEIKLVRRHALEGDRRSSEVSDLQFIRISSEAKNWAWFSSEHFRRLRQGFRKGEATDKTTAILTVFGPLNSFKIQSGMQSLLKTLRLILCCGKPLSKRCWFSVTLLFSIAKKLVC